MIIKNLQIGMTCCLMLLSTLIQGQSTGTLTIGVGTTAGTGVNWTPIYRSSATSTFDWSRAAYLYDATELAAAGLPAGATITAVEWNKNNNGATVATSSAVVFNILMNNSALSSYTGTTSWTALTSGATAVYGTTAQVIPASLGFLNFTLTNPFVYTGGALEIFTDWDISAVSGSPTTAGFTWLGTAIASRVLGTSSGSSLTPTSNLTSQATRPNIRIIYSYTPLLNDVGLQTLVTPGLVGCYGSSENVSAIIKNFGSNSVSNIPVNIFVSGAVSQTLSTVFTGPLASGATATVNVGNLNMTTSGTYSFNGSTNLSGDSNTLNDVMTPTSRTVTPVSTIPQTVNFTGFTGANLTTVFPLWSEATGSVNPTGTTSSWLSQSGLVGAGNISARVNLYTTTRNEWIVGTKFTATSNSQLSFDAAVSDWNSIVTPANMGSDDKVRVMVSTNCGLSYTPIFTISATNSLTLNYTNFIVPLGSFAGQDIIVAFLAQDGPIADIEDYDFHLDNINLYNLVPTDVGLSAFVSPPANACYSASENVVVAITNYGSAAQSNIPVNVIVSGAVSQTLSGTYTGPLAPSTTANFTVGTLNMSTSGTYTINGSTSLAGDLNNANDAFSQQTRIVTPVATLPQTVDFTGFTGANLPTNFPLWYEANGATVPTGTTSVWLSQTGLVGAGNISARINLYTTTRNEWIVGPKFTATSNSQLTFDAAVSDWNSITVPATMGSDDQVRVMVSTNCGLSYTPIFTLNASNSLGLNYTNFTVPLGSYAGQDIIIAFLAQDGPFDDPEDYDFHLDNINLGSALAIDAGVNGLVTPLASGCYSNSETVAVTIRNFGINSISNVPVSVVVSGPITQTLTGSFPGTILSGATANFTVGTINMSMSGTYSFAANTNYPGDLNNLNDSYAITRTTQPLISILGNKSICSGNSSTLTAGGAGTTFTWSTGANTSSIVVTPTSATIYTLTASNGTCTSMMIDSVSVINPTITAMGATACAPNNGTLTANAFSTVNWYASPTSTISLATGNSYVPTVTTTTTFYAEAQSTSSNSMTPLMVSNNGSNGNMFDIVALNNIEITGFDVNIGGTLTTTVEVWYRPGSFVGFETSNVGWTNVLTTTVTGLGTDNLVFVPSNFTVAIPAGQTYAFYVTANGGSNFRYTNGTAVGNIYAQNSDLQFLEGKGGGYFGVTISTRIWNGQIRYNANGCTSPRVPATMSVGISPSVTATSSNTLLCAGSSATLVASGAPSYTWNTGATTQGIVVSPTVTTSYTVTGINGICSTDFVITQNVTTCTGINQTLAENSGIIIYPNPNSGSLNVVISDLQSATKIEIYDALGRLVLTSPLETKAKLIDTSDLSKGVYIYRILDSNGLVKQGKLMKE